MKKILLALGVVAMVVSSCGTKSNAQKEEVKAEVEATQEAPAAEATEVEATVENDSTACCDKDTTAVDCEKTCPEAEAADKKEVEGEKEVETPEDKA